MFTTSTSKAKQRHPMQEAHSMPSPLSYLSFPCSLFVNINHYSRPLPGCTSLKTRPPSPFLAQQAPQMTPLLAVTRYTRKLSPFSLVQIHYRRDGVKIGLSGSAETEFVPFGFWRREFYSIPDNAPGSHGDAVRVHESWN